LSTHAKKILPFVIRVILAAIDTFSDHAIVGVSTSINVL
jgi:hypothetical protein